MLVLFPISSLHLLVLFSTVQHSGCFSSWAWQMFADKKLEIRIYLAGTGTDTYPTKREVRKISDSKVLAGIWDSFHSGAFLSSGM